MRLISERDLLREQQRAHDDRHEHRIAEIVGTLTNEDDPQARYDARARLHQILGRYIAAVLKPGRTVTVSIGAHSGMAPANAVIGPDGLREISVIDPHDGTVLMTYDRASLCLLDPIKARPSALMSARACALNAAQPFAEPTAA